MCCVFGTPHPDRGEEVTAVVVVAPGAEYVQGDVTARVRQELSAFKVPTRWIVIEPRRLPWLGSGKVDRLGLRRLIESGELG
jgi:acyl-coenzyme A synthetase/AMP-(fatty) acid ligase